MIVIIHHNSPKGIIRMIVYSMSNDHYYDSYYFFFVELQILQFEINKSEENSKESKSDITKQNSTKNDERILGVSGGLKADFIETNLDDAAESISIRGDKLTESNLLTKGEEPHQLKKRKFKFVDYMILSLESLQVAETRHTKIQILIFLTSKQYLSSFRYILFALIALNSTRRLMNILHKTKDT